MADDSLQQYVQEKISSGDFDSPEEFASEAIRIYRTLESDYGHLQSQVKERIAKVRNGDLKQLDVARLKDELSRNICK